MWAVAFVVSAAVLYVGSYYALLDMRTARLFHAFSRSGRPYVPEMKGRYRFGGDVAASLFRPIERVDRWLRPGELE